MYRIIVSLLFIPFCSKSQTFSVSDDSVSFIVKVGFSKQDSIENISLTIKNYTSSNIFICKPGSRTGLAYLNLSYGPFIIGCGCEYGFNQDNFLNTGYEVIRVPSGDSLKWEFENPRSWANRKISKTEFNAAIKTFKLDYVSSRNELLFINRHNIYKNFMQQKRKISFSTFSQD